jgi:NAD(P)H-dependent flavin oxidoreductase YrpB (nitropropane dioxygenase family)
MQAPIGGVVTVDLIEQVCAAGALGTFAASWTPVARLTSEIEELRRRCDRPFAVNLVLAFDQEERVEACIALGVPVVSLSWGVRPDLVRRLRAAGTRVLVQVGDVTAGRAAVAAGADALIAQGREAGGHVQSVTGLRDLVRSLAHAVSAPIIAAGGIADDVTARAAIVAGAGAVALGTRFVATAESAAALVWKEGIVGAGETDTILTGLFDVGWPDAPHRVLRNSTYRAWEGAGWPPAGARPGEGELIAHRGGESFQRYSDVPPAADMVGDLEGLCLYAGKSVGSIGSVVPAADVVAAVARGL